MDERILSKIKKLLALAKSGNEHEAANALRLAQKLMQEHQLSEQEVKLSEVSQREIKRANAADKQPQWANLLTGCITNAFGLEAILSWKRDIGASLIFIGPVDRVEIGTYCYEVLAPQLVKARKTYLASLNKRLKLTTKTNRADLFAEGWISAVRRQVHALVPTEEEQNLIQLYKEKHFTRLEKTEVRLTQDKKRDVSAFLEGHGAGRNVRLNAGVNGAEQGKIGSKV
ncbi:DUF2786 domain-containing protein [Rheinheimera maricola]|uniref:DUF2786 domain-containing protein n=1 Tax=Rheinheimera maricola TaxID=2793282 RepID=A0ABS7X832_9GAMM|nr:DUF2786 domain-containing protein [Rheinheimera maricola]MBZ9610772.1 DUF2786 domain-containing protein [Rheinheimera maricola]